MVTLYWLLIYIYIHTVVREKFNGGNFHVKKFSVKIFSSSRVANEIFLTVNNCSVEIFHIRFSYNIMSNMRGIICATWRHLPATQASINC